MRTQSFTGGPFVLPLAKEYGVNILPADSEHSAIFQCMQARGTECKRLTLAYSWQAWLGKGLGEAHGATPRARLGRAERTTCWSLVTKAARTGGYTLLISPSHACAGPA